MCGIVGCMKWNAMERNTAVNGVIIYNIMVTKMLKWTLNYFKFIVKYRLTLFLYTSYLALWMDFKYSSSSKIIL